jgi:hypothetical protein
LYIGKDNISADQIDFKKALDLMDYVSNAEADEEDVRNLRLHIWSQAVLR